MRSIAACLMPIVSLFACAGPVRGQEPVTPPTGEYAIAYLDLEGKVADSDGDTPYRSQIVLSLRDHHIATAWLPLDVVVTDTSGLMFDGQSLRGEIVDRQVGEEPGKLVRCKLDAQASGEKISGLFELSYQDGIRRRTVSGKVQGELHTAARLLKANALAASASWPCWRGPSGNLAGSAAETAWVDSLHDARRVWKGEEEQPGSPGRTGGLTRKLLGVPKTRISGGGASPVVADGRVIVSYFVPSGEVYDRRAIDELTKTYGPDFTNREKVKVSADDVVLCLDAATGQTLWKTVFAGQGLNWQEHKSSPNNLSPVVHERRVYAIGSTLRLNCLDLATGKPLWQSHLGPKHLAIEKAKIIGLEKQAYQGANLGVRHMGGAPIVIGGVLVVNDMVSDLCGFSLADGKELWRVAGANDGNAPPARWTHQGSEFAIASNSAGLTCVRPADGQVQWKLELPVGGSDCVVNVSGDLLCSFALDADGQRQTEEETGAGNLVCYELSLTGAKQRWSIPANVHSQYAFPHIAGDRVYISGRDQTDCVELASGKVLRTAAGPGASNGGLMFSSGDRLFISQDGKHGETRLMMLTATGEKVEFTSREPWKGPHAHTTAYGHTPMAYPILDGRLFVRGGDAVYCYDLRKPN